MDPIEEWAKLKRRIRLSYYIGEPAVDAIEAAVLGGLPAPPRTIGIDIDNDGEVDATVSIG